MNARIEERQQQFQANLETIRAENPRPEIVSDFAFSSNCDEFKVGYEEFIQDLKTSLACSGVYSEKSEALSEKIIGLFAELQLHIEEEKSIYEKKQMDFKGDILRKKEEEEFLSFLQEEMKTLGFDSVLRVPKQSLPIEVFSKFDDIYKALEFTHINKTSFRDEIFYDSKKFDGKITHIVEEKYRELGGVPFHNLTGFIKIEKISQNIDKLLTILYLNDKGV